jgi:hypothetical protein
MDIIRQGLYSPCLIFIESKKDKQMINDCFIVQE